MPEEKLWTVSEVNSAVRDVIEGGFSAFWIEAEVGTLNLHRSGHVYLTLKDAKNQLKGVYFGGASQVQALQIQVGSKIEAFGQLTVYQVRGEYQFSIKTLRPVGIGDLHRRFEELKQRLGAEGLFDDNRKKQLPMLPGRIGVVTAPGGAALRDFLQIINRRFPDICIRIYPSSVQGKGAERQIAAGVDFFNRTDSVDVIIVMRGGGSMEDLWPFNEEILARSIANSRIPVISAVGHEIDFSISDFVADLRVPTPSAAAELVIGQQDAFRELIVSSKRRIDSVLKLMLEQSRRRFERAAGSPVFQEPLHMVQQQQQKIDELESRSERAVKTALERCELRLNHSVSNMNNLNPMRVLERGYSILLDAENGKAVMSPLETGRKVEAIVSKGKMNLTVTE